MLEPTSTLADPHLTPASSASGFFRITFRAFQSFRPASLGVVLAMTILTSCSDLKLVPPGPVPPATLSVINVNSTLDSVDANPGDFTCADAQNKCSLRAAIIEANAVDGPQTINIPAGRYTLTIPGVGEEDSATGDLDLTGETYLVGADAATTIIDANALDRAFDTGRVDRKTIAVSAKNLTVRGGTASASGGGWASAFTALTLENILFSANTSTGDGGGLSVGELFFDSGTSNLNNVRFEGNSASGSGGGMANFDGVSSVQNSSFSKNTARGQNDGRASDGGGGGLYSRTSIEISASSFTANVATNGWGGGILAYKKVNISTSNISGNDAQGCGGGMALNHYPFYGAAQISNLSITSSSLTANTATDGAGLCTDLGSAILTNTTVSGNKASNAGGGISATSTAVSLTHATLADNTALLAGGRDLYSGSNSALVVRASILASGGTSCVSASGSITSTGGNVIADASCAFSSSDDLQSANAQLAGLSAVSNQVFSVRLPAAASPAVNRVPANLCSSTDARGVTRPQGAACDSGAVERSSTDP